MHTATAYFRYSTTNPGACNDTFGTRFPATGGTNITSTNQGFSQLLTGLVPGTTYYYRITAFNGAGQSAYSNVASAKTTVAVANAPASPTNLQFSSTSTSVTLTWTDTSTNESGFHIYASESGG